MRYPNVYGIDMPAAHELIAHDRTDEEVAREIGADWLVYQELDDLVEACREGNPGITRFEDSIFTGDYVTGDVDSAYLTDLQLARSDDAKASEHTRGTPLTSEEQDLVFDREG